MNTINRRILAIDGPNGGGKSTVADIVKSMVTGITVIEHHDFFHKHITRKLGREIYRPEDWIGLNKTERRDSLKYIQSRDSNTVKYINSIAYDDVLLERFALTGIVYCDLLSFDLQQYLSHTISLLEKLNNLEFIYVSCAEDILLERNLRETPKKLIRQSTGSPYHLLSESAIKRKHALYEKHFQNLPIEKKIYIDTSEITDKEIRNRLRGKWNL